MKLDKNLLEIIKKNKNMVKKKSWENSFIIWEGKELVLYRPDGRFVINENFNKLWVEINFNEDDWIIIEGVDYV